MNKLTRRRFLAATGVTAAGALAVGATQVDWSDLLTAAQTSPLDPKAGVLVVVTLYGGNDGLNTVVPAGDPAYQNARHELAYQPNEVLDLGSGLGLNPGMKGMSGLWHDQKLAVVRGIGYPKPDHSHFRSMAIWQTGSPDTQSKTGWLGRWLDATGDDPLRALSVEPVLPPLLAGDKTAGASLPEGGLRLPTGSFGDAVHALSVAQPGEGPDQARVSKSFADLYQAAKVLGGVPGVEGGAGGKGKGAKGGKGGKHAGASAAPTTTASPDPNGGDDQERQNGASAGGRGALGSQLDLVAGLVEAGVPTRAYSVSLGGFDTHADERGTQQRLLTELDAALTPFVQRMRGTDRGRNVVVLVYSEFGRRVEANASDGTDHGTAGPMFLMGDRVKGGFYGEQPSLTDLDNGDLKESTDFRDVYGTLLEKVLGADAGPVLPGHSGRLDSVLA